MLSKFELDIYLGPAGFSADFTQVFTEFSIIWKNRWRFNFHSVNQYDPYIFIPRVYLIDNKNETTGALSSPKIFIKSNPTILIFSQYLIDLSDIGQSVFEVTSNDSKIYEKACVKIVSVLKGTGSTALDKVSYLYNKNNITLPGINFYDNIVNYSLVRYFLSKLLYGNFDIKYLLNKYYPKFIRDLTNSKYNNFVNFFTDPQSDVYNYNKYFK